jgi:hypothetical protein
MVTLRCTASLFKRLGGPPPYSIPSETNVTAFRIRMVMEAALVSGSIDDTSTQGADGLCQLACRSSF